MLVCSRIGLMWGTPASTYGEYGEASRDLGTCALATAPIWSHVSFWGALTLWRFPAAVHVEALKNDSTTELIELTLRGYIRLS